MLLGSSMKTEWCWLGSCVQSREASRTRTLQQVRYPSIIAKEMKMSILKKIAGLRQARARAALLVTLIAGAAALPIDSVTADQYVPANPEPGTDIPAASVTFGMRPYADNTFYVIAMKK